MILVIFLLTGAFFSIVDACFSPKFKGLQFDLEIGNASSGRFVLSIIYMLYEYVGICPSSGNSTNDLHLTATALAQHAHQKYNVKSQGGRVRWRGEAKQTE